MDSDIFNTLIERGYTQSQATSGAKCSSLEHAIEYLAQHGSWVDGVSYDHSTPVVPILGSHNHRVMGNNHHNFHDSQAKSFSSLQFETDIIAAIQNSMQDQIHTTEVPNPHERKREDKKPVGLKNVGNTCYFNSVAQSYFTISQFRNEILSLEFEDGIPDNDIRRVAEELQKLFGFMILTNRKYVDPSPLLNTLVDKEGKPIHKGAQEDPTEFSISFLERIKESVIKLISNEENDENKDETENLNEENSISSVTEGLNKVSIKDDDESDTPFAMDDEDELIPSQKDTGEAKERENEENSDSQKKEDDEDQDKKPKKEEPRTFVDDLFSGKFKQQIISKEEDGTDVKLISDFSFMQLILTLTNSQNIYESLDTYTYMKIDEFTTPKKFKSTAEQITSFKELPPVLTFLIQRVDYDQTHQRESKNNQRFEFPKELYMGRYLDKNFDQTRSTDNVEIEKLRKKIQQSKNRITQLENYNGTGYSITTILNGTKHYLDEKRFIARGAVSKEEETLYTTIQNSIADVKKELAQLEKNIEIYQIQIKEIYIRCKENPYNLHAVLVHDGLAGGGHYWAFLYSKGEECWYKYDDTTVRKVAEELVWKESYGGHGNQSAYCLIYLSNQNSFECPDDAYTIIPIQVQVKIAEDNQEFDEEILQWDIKIQKEEEERKRVQEIEERNKLLAMQEEQRHHLWINDHQFQSSQNNQQIALNDCDLDEFYCGYIDDIQKITHSSTNKKELIPNLQSFASFLYSVQMNDLFKFEVAEQRSMNLFNLPLRTKSTMGFHSSASKIITRCQLQQVSDSYYLAYKQIYDNCFTVLEYFTQACQLIVNQEFGKALEFLHCAYIRDTKTVVNVIHANRAGTIVEFMSNTIGRITALILESWHVHQDTWKTVETVIRIISDPRYNSEFQEFSAMWSQDISKKQDIASALPPELNVFVCKLENILCEQKSTDFGDCDVDVPLKDLWGTFATFLSYAKTVLESQ